VLVLVVGVVAAYSGLTIRVASLSHSFIVTYPLGVGALTFLNIGVFDIGDPKFREVWLKFWLEVYWPLWTIFFAPSAICALLASWFSGVTQRRDAVVMLGVFFALILITIEIGWVFDPYIGRHGFWPLLGAFVILSAIFFWLALAARARRANEGLLVKHPDVGMSYDRFGSD
jgi:hypothetical protein